MEKHRQKFGRMSILVWLWPKFRCPKGLNKQGERKMKKASEEESRIIGIVHRVKRTADNEARPTLVCILNPGKKKPETLQLE